MRYLNIVKRCRTIYYIAGFLSIIASGLFNHVPIYATSSDVNYEVNIASGISITIPSNTVTLNLNPFVTAFGSTNLPVTVKTNNATGYTLTMSPSDDTTTSLTRTGGAETIPTLADLSGGYTEQTFTTNKWGYKLSSTNYLPFATSNEITTTNTPTAASGNTSTVTFAAKGDTSLTAGIYNLEISFAAVANPLPPPTMQNLSASLCTSTPTTVVDSRDGEEYLVRRLADGKCWMLDNLRLDLVAYKSNLSSTNTNATDAELAYLKGTSVRDPVQDPNGQYATAGVSYWPYGSSYSEPWFAIQSSPTSDWDPDTTITSYGDGSGKIGIYYNYCAASAGTYCYGNGSSSSATSGNATADICPAGWRMPTSYGNDSEYQTLINSYDVTAAAVDATSPQYNLSTPLSGAFVHTSTMNKGNNGYFWGSSRTGSGDIYMGYLMVYSDYVVTSGYDRLLGISMRCILK